MWFLLWNFFWDIKISVVNFHLVSRTDIHIVNISLNSKFSISECPGIIIRIRSNLWIQWNGRKAWHCINGRGKISSTSVQATVNSICWEDIWDNQRQSEEGNKSILDSVHTGTTNKSFPLPGYEAIQYHFLIIVDFHRLQELIVWEHLGDH